MGGPGGMPVRPQGPTNNAQTLLTDAWRLVLPQGMTLANGGEGVHVAIIDTMPCHTDLKRAYKRWGKTNGLLATLLGPGGPLKLYPAGNAHLLQSVDYHLNQHEYPMPDHGLFVAGIIHSIAPKAQIHLIEGLNTYGVGTFETFANAIALAQRIALKQSLADVDIEDMGSAPTTTTSQVAGSAAPDVAIVTQVRPDRAGTSASTLTPDYLPMVLNCSFVFTAPPEAGDDPLHRASSYLTTIWDTLNIRDDMLIVGAAGNDAHGEGVASRPQERFPAAFTSVVGVAALDQHGNPTLYTDTANLPGKDNFAVFGGVAQLGATAADPNVTDAQFGMLGIYSGTKYPDGTPNPDGWARWAGTSFAAPIISGALALALAPTAATGLGNPIKLSSLHTYALERVRGAVAGVTNTSAPDATPPGDIAPPIIVSQ